jgi:hypothetical protein
MNSAVNQKVYEASLASLTHLEIMALKAAFVSSRGNGHDFGFSDDVEVPGQSAAANGALVTNLLKKHIITRDEEFGQIALGAFSQNDEPKGVWTPARAVEKFLRDREVL